MKRARVIPNPQPQLQDDHGPGRKASISREDLMAAALKLVGPHRSVSTLSLREVARDVDYVFTNAARQAERWRLDALAQIPMPGLPGPPG